MKIHGTAKGGALSKKDFGVAFGGGGAVSNFNKDDMKIYYRFEQTSGNLENTASDVGSSDAIADSDLVVTNATQGATGKIDYGVSFASGSEVLKATSMAPSALGFLSNNGAVWTICGWIKTSSLAGDQMILANTDFGGGDNGFWLRMKNDSGNMQIIFGTSGDDRVNQTTTTAIPDTDWNFLMVQYNDSTGDLKMSVNNGTVETVAGSLDLTNTDTPTTYLYVGNDLNDGNDWIGSLDEFVIFNRILTTDEITDLYADGDGLVIV